MRPLYHPSIDEVTVEGILHALSDPVRVAIYAAIAASDCPRNCSNFLKVRDRDVPKSTLSQHFRILRDAGLIRAERRGVHLHNTARCADIDARFPGLVAAVLTAYQAQSRGRRHRGKTARRTG
jgi:DNA-binding transcriptional ArsR family regulator